MSDESEIRFVGEMHRLDLRPGDKLVLTTEVHLTGQQCENLQKHLESKFEGHEVIVLSGGLKLGAIRLDQD